ncbi:MAG: outer membrane receptor for ferrienterochelin and colicins [Bacteroidia bacterium]|jgi:outer membrane receptor for ferrienterochelin and colicins
MKHTFLAIVAMLCLTQAQAQNKICGHVESSDHDKEGPLIGASVFWLGTTTGVAGDVEGEFCIEEPTSYPARLVVSHVSSESDTILFTEYTSKEVHAHLQPIKLETVTVTATEKASSYDLMNPILVENLGSKELKKAACCNLSESFESNASVDVVVSDAVSGARKIRMMGLDGVYTQIQGENMPLIRGLSMGSGMLNIPGTWVESIQISKGPGSVVNGYEAMIGQINVEFQKPDEADTYFINLYGNVGGRAEANLQYAKQITPKVGTTFFGHASARLRENDSNNDGFMDMPLSQQYIGFNRWKFKMGDWRAQVGVRGSYDNRIGGQLGYKKGLIADVQPYGIEILNRQIDLTTKTAKLFDKHDDLSIAIVTNWRYHDLNSQYGLKTYEAIERMAYGNLIIQNAWKEDKHRLRAGASYLYDDHVQHLTDSAWQIIEHVPGAYAEYTFSMPLKFSLVAGIRGDYHNKFGMMVTPRLHLKYHLADLTTIRVSGGRGYRTARPFADNPSLFASSRRIEFTPMTKPEESWNYGISFSHSMRLWRRELTVTSSFFRTEFINQMVIDMDSEQRALHIYPLEGRSYSNSFQIDLSYEPLPRTTINLAYKLNDAHTEYRVGELLNPLVDRHLGLINLGYFTKGQKNWAFDLTVQFHGDARIPSTSTNPVEYQVPVRSPFHVIINAQVTKTFKWFEVYLGAENLTNYRQPNAIIAADDPFGEHFDATMIWGPTMGINPYLGIRMKFNPKKKS